MAPVAFVATVETVARVAPFACVADDPLMFCILADLCLLRDCKTCVAQVCAIWSQRRLKMPSAF